MHREIEKYLAHLVPLLLQRGIDISDKREISYGLQLRLSRNADKSVLNLYYSEKKGLSTVVGGSSTSDLKAELEALLLGERNPYTGPGLHSWNSWIGSDECGKGDYFGPLIGSAFYCSKDQVPKLKEIGVEDSKKLNEKQIYQVAKELYLNFPGQANSVVIKPRRYNELIADFKQRGRNLNDLLAWLHFKVISGILDERPNTEGVIIDQFSKAQKARSLIIPKYPDVNVVERTAAERDIAVAAASILSRYQFLEHMKKMNSRFDMNFPLGANKRVIDSARSFIQKHGKDKFDEVAKLHFKTTQQLGL